MLLFVRLQLLLLLMPVIAAAAAGVCVCVTLCRLQDQLIVFMALAEGTSSMLCNEPTLHTR